jgi:hypothetical protein
MSEPTGSSPAIARSRRGRALLVIAGAVLAGCLAAEAGLRLAWLRRRQPGGDDNWHEHDDRLGWRNRPGATFDVRKRNDGHPLDRPFHVTIDGRGLRDRRDFVDAPPPGVTRIACTGSSFTFGYCVEAEESYPKVLESLLGPGTEVWNCGVCGYGLDQSLLALERDVLPAKPSLVLFAVDESNFRRVTRGNFYDGLLKPRFALEGGRLKQVREFVPEVKPGDLYERIDVEGSFLAFVIGQAWDRLCVKLSRDPEAADESWTLGSALVREAARAARGAGARFAVVLLPTPRRLEEGRDPYERLLQSLADEGTLVCDLYPEFRSRDWRSLFILQEGHPNPAGHRVEAEAIAKFVASHELLGRRP